MRPITDKTMIVGKFTGRPLSSPACNLGHPLRNLARTKGGVGMVVVPATPANHHIDKGESPLLIHEMGNRFGRIGGRKDPAETSIRGGKNRLPRGPAGGRRVSEKLKELVNRLLGHEPVGCELTSCNVPPGRFRAQDLVGA